MRRRHAHAWAIAHIDGAWQAVDATPSQWLQMEDEQAELWQPIYDFFSTLYFQYKQWRYQQALAEAENDDNLLWLSIAALLLLVLVWRLYTLRHQLSVRSRGGAEWVSFDYPGQDSELYLIEQALAETEQARQENESVAVWAKRIDNQMLIDIARMHYQYRFDSDSFSQASRCQLKQAVQSWLTSYR